MILLSKETDKHKQTVSDSKEVALLSETLSEQGFDNLRTEGATV